MELIDVVEKLIGKVRPVGESNEDVSRFRNLMQMINLTNELIKRIDAVAYDNRDAREHSVKQCADLAKDWIEANIKD